MLPILTIKAWQIMHAGICNLRYQYIEGKYNDVHQDFLLKKGVILIIIEVPFILFSGRKSSGLYLCPIEASLSI